MTGIDKGIPLVFSGGINRDNTKFKMNCCVDGEWVRFRDNRPKKIGGFRNINGNNFQSIPRGANVVSRNGVNYYFTGLYDKLLVAPINNDGSGGSAIDRTPSGFISNTKNIWQFDDMFDDGSNKRIIFAHAGQNLNAIDNSFQTPVYYGDATNSTQLTSVGENVSGGVCCLHPYPMLYGNDGFITWPAPGTVNFNVPGVSGSARITGSKIIKGVSIRGGAGYSPAGLFWSLDSLNRIYFVGGQSIFANESVGSTYLLSSSAVVEYNGLFFWPSADGRFCMWNGGINDLPNDYNQLFFFKNLNFSQRQKVWGMKVGAYNEIWWFFPLGNATECNHAIIFNVKEQTWYDTPISRSCGVSAKVFNYPVMYDNQPNPIGFYNLWQHEYGVDEQTGLDNLAIKSYFETPVQTLVEADRNVWMKMDWFEPDFVQSGNLSFRLTGEVLPQTPPTMSNVTHNITPTTGKIDIIDQRRYLRMHIESNVAGGDYYMGKPMMKISEGAATLVG